MGAIRKMIRFGVAGAPNKFYELGHKASLEMPAFLHSIGLDAFEYQCGRGVNIGASLAQKLGEEAKKYNITLSIHSPYYINIANPDEKKRKNSLRYILQTLEAAKNMGANRIVVHMGGGSDNRQTAMEYSRKFIPYMMDAAAEQKLDDITICFETMGKINQLGSVEETLEICSLNDLLLPCLDFGHINARTQGSLKTEEDFEQIITQMQNILGTERARNFHCHFSKILYTKAGESKHLTFEDTEYGPEFAPLAKVLKKHKCEPIIISESRGTQDIDALAMKQIMKGLK